MIDMKNNMNKNMREIIDFCNNYRNIYIYGAGNYGKICAHYLQQHSIVIRGFIISQGSTQLVDGLPVFLAYQKLKDLTLDTGIIVAVKDEFQIEILKTLEYYQIKSLFVIKKNMCLDMDLCVQKAWLDVLQAHQPASKHIQPNRWKKILIIRLDAIGDMIFTTAFFRELRFNFPHSEITIVVRDEILPLVQNAPYFDSVLSYHCKLRQGALTKEIIAQAKKFAEDNLLPKAFDVVFLPRHLYWFYDAFSNVLLAIYSGAKDRIARIGIEESCERTLFNLLQGLFTIIVRHRYPTHEVDRTLDLLRVCKCKIHNTSMELWPEPIKDDFIKNLVKSKGQHFFIAIALVTNVDNRNWSVEFYRMVMEYLCKKYKRICFILFGGDNAKKAVENLEIGQLPIVNLISKTTLSQAVNVMNICDMYVGGDTGIMHMAAALRKPVVEISMHLPDGTDMGIHAPARVGPYGVDSVVVMPKKGLDGCEGDCHANYPHCINQITVEEVTMAIEKMINSHRENIEL